MAKTDKQDKKEAILIAVFLGIIILAFLENILWAKSYLIIILMASIVFVEVMLNKVGNYRLKILLTAILICAILFTTLVVYGIIRNTPVDYSGWWGTQCISQPGFLTPSEFTCQNPILHGDWFSVYIGQATGANWTDVSFLWVPSGQLAPSANVFCPPAGSTTINETTCATPNSMYLASGRGTMENFTFSQPTTVGSTYHGTIWAVYQTNVGGGWYEARITSVVNLKSV